jgi:hypothetical protein
MSSIVQFSPWRQIESAEQVTSLGDECFAPSSIPREGLILLRFFDTLVVVVSLVIKDPYF